jgi:ribonucleoside-triphosphate reductase (thioredoxin)
MSLKALSDYTFYSRYAQYKPEEKRRETWDEAVTRVFDMHKKKYKKQLLESKILREEIEFAESQVKKKRVLGAQRALQYGGDPILKRNERIYNCSSLLIDKPFSFQQVVWLLLAGCGVGFSVQKHHIAKLPPIVRKNKNAETVTFVVPDTCEGWADSVGVLLSSYFKDGGTFPEYKGKHIEFDFSQIRPKGSLIAGQFKAPGPEPLKNGLEKIKNLIELQFDIDALNMQWLKENLPQEISNHKANGFIRDEAELRPIVAYDILMHSSDFVISGGLRRSATICLFSPDDHEMMEAKTGRWFVDNPQRGRSNNSVVLKRSDTDFDEFKEIFESIKQAGEPGFFFCDDDYATTTNPCVEIGFWPMLEDGRSGVNFCNLTEINGKWCTDEEKFLQACRASAIIGTLQAGYNEFPYLGDVTEEIVRTEALLGCSITGWMDNPDILFNEKILEKGAKEIKRINEKIAAIIGINPAARLTCSKPAGSTSCVLKTASGIHPHHARRYIRRVQANKQEFPLQHFKETNPIAVEESVWSANNTDEVISFVCEVPSGAITKNQVDATKLLESVKKAQKHWVLAGNVPERSLHPGVTHNVSNTITVQEDEWDDVCKYIYKNRQYFTGVSLLPASGDLDYMQAPFSTVLTPNELVREYGDASVFASGLIVDGLHAFDNNLWEACDTVLGMREEIESVKESPTYPINVTNKALAEYFLTKEGYDTWFAKVDWIRRAKQFAKRYFDGDVRKMTYCLKHVSLWKTWCDLQREYKEVDWKNVEEIDQTYVDADTLASAACVGTKGCEI